MTETHDGAKTETSNTLSRRQFVTATAGAAAFTALSPALVHGTTANNKIKLGIIGCGRRGHWIAGLFANHGGFEVVAAADYFQDRVDATGEKFNLPANRRYTGLSGYERLLESDVDAVAIISPPYFHPEQAAAAVAAGKHVYLAKPIAVDVPGCQTIAASGEQATANKLAFLVDFQTRAMESFIEAVKRVHDGALGEFTFGQAVYHTNRLTPKAEPGTPESWLRNWVFDIKLSGDIIVEQNIHALDVMSWIMDKPPLHAVGSGGRKSRVDIGDCWDHFALLYQYPDDVGVTFSSRQYNDGDSPSGIFARIYGSEGTIDTAYGGDIQIFGENSYAGKTNNIYRVGVNTNIAAFHQNISNANYENLTVAPSVRSNLVSILGRTAAYEKRVVSWEELMKSDERMQPDLKGYKA